MYAKAVCNVDILLRLGHVMDNWCTLSFIEHTLFYSTALYTYILIIVVFFLSVIDKTPEVELVSSHITYFH